MIIAQQKKRENIAEYLLYMYQVEDLIRAYEFDLTRIEQFIINKFETTYDLKREMLEWYKALISMMRDEGLQKSGHIQSLNKISGELNDFHIKMISSSPESDYRMIYEKAKPNIEALRMRGGHTNDHDIQIALNGLYGLLILRLQKREVSKETETAFQTITEMIALLSAKFMERDQL